MTEHIEIHLIDDEVDVTNSLKWLLETVNLASLTYNDPRGFLERYSSQVGPCIIVSDLRMPFHSGLDLFEAQKRLHRTDPVILLTGHGDVRTAVRAMKLGAFDFLMKPFNPQEFLDCINRAADQALEMWQQADRHRAQSELVSTLSAREKDVFEFILDGASSKQIARQLEISVKTVDVHRSKIPHKLRVRTAHELISKFATVAEY